MWVHAAGAAIYLARWLAGELGLPVHASLQDDPSGHNKQIGDVVRPYFAQLIKQIATADVASMAMKRQYDRTFGVELDARPVQFGTTASVLLPPPIIRPIARRMAYAGNVWCDDSVQAVCEAIERKRNRSDSMSLTIYSQKLPRWMRGYRTVRYGGLVPSNKVASVLSQHDLLFCPMGFSERHRPLTEYSFPSKIFTYLQAQLPILAHGPPYGTHMEFVANKDVGLTIDTLDVSVIADRLERYQHDEPQRARQSRNARALIVGPMEPTRATSELVEFIDR